MSLVCGYALLGATWLIMKSEGTLQARCYRLAFGLAIGTIVAIARGERRDAVPERRLLAALVRLAAGPVHRRRCRCWSPLPRWCSSSACSAGTTYTPFLMALLVFALSLAGLGISLFPYVVPPAITIWDAAAPTASLIFMLPGALVMVPIILAYTGYSYWVFRGKTGPEGYH